MEGYRAALFFAVGILLSDLTCLLLANWGASQFVYDQKYARFIGVLGGFLLIAFGLYEIFNKGKEVNLSDDKVGNTSVGSKPVLNIVKAYLMNIMTPFVFVFWIVWAGVINVRYGEEPLRVAAFFSIVLLTVFIIDNTKAYLATKLRVFISIKSLRLVRVIAGLLLMFFGVYLFVRVFVNDPQQLPSAMFGIGM